MEGRPLWIYDRWGITQRQVRGGGTLFGKHTLPRKLGSGLGERGRYTFFQKYPLPGWGDRKWRRRRDTSCNLTDGYFTGDSAGKGRGKKKTRGGEGTERKEKSSSSIPIDKRKCACEPKSPRKILLLNLTEKTQGRKGEIVVEGRGEDIVLLLKSNE